jgi:hypothetical protein
LSALTTTSLSIKRAGEVPGKAKQRIIIFLFNEGEKAADIHRRLPLPFGTECLSRSSAFPRWQTFNDVREPLLNTSQAQHLATEVNQGFVFVDFCYRKSQ